MRVHLAPLPDGRTPGAARAAAAWTSVLPAVLSETRPHRAALHRAVPAGRCDLRISISGRGGGPIHIEGDCACRDFLVDMLVEAHRLLVAHAGKLHNPPGAVRTHIRTRAACDWIRRRRIEMGAQARVDRIRSAARARSLPDEFHRALLEYLVDEAGSPAPLEGQESLVQRLAVRCATEFGGMPEQYHARVVRGIAVVERHCRSGPRVNDGTAGEPDYVTWWERYVERPLGRRPRRSDLPIPDWAAAPASDGSDGLVVATLVDAVRRRPDAPATALRDGLRELVEQGLLAHRTATALLDDRRRLTAVADELSALA